MDVDDIIDDFDYFNSSDSRKYVASLKREAYKREIARIRAN